MEGSGEGGDEGGGGGGKRGWICDTKSGEESKIKRVRERWAGWMK